MGLCKNVSGEREKNVSDVHELSTINGTEQRPGAVSRVCCKCALNISCNWDKLSTCGKAYPCRASSCACMAYVVIKCINGADCMLYAPRSSDRGLLGRLFGAQLQNFYWKGGKNICIGANNGGLDRD